jgi:hypothetical protein
MPYLHFPSDLFSILNYVSVFYLHVQRAVSYRCVLFLVRSTLTDSKRRNIDCLSLNKKLLETAD